MKYTGYNNFVAREESINCQGLEFLCIYGKHINGGFLAITNWGVAAELSAYRNDVKYNTDKILAALERSPDVSWLPRSKDGRKAIAHYIAQIIDERIKSL